MYGLAQIVACVCPWYACSRQTTSPSGRPLDAAHPGYQPPLTDEERAGVRPDFDAADAMETEGAPT